MADAIIKPDDTNDVIIQNNDGSAKIEVNEAQNIILTGGSTTALTIDTSGITILSGSKDNTTANAANCYMSSVDGQIYRSTNSTTITGTANEITVTNGDGVSGNPTISLPSEVNLGDGSKLTTDEVRAFDGAGLNLYDDGGSGISIADGGIVSLGGSKDNTTANAANCYMSSVDGQIYRSTSSIKYKKNVETILDTYADAILTMRPVWYRSKSENDNPDWGYWGLIAEEVAEIDPRLVFWATEEQVEQEVTKEIPAQEAVLDDEGNIVKEAVEVHTITEIEQVAVPLETPEAEGVQYDRIVPHLINLLQRQNAKIESLFQRLTALENA